MAEVDPGCSCFRHLVEQVIPEELQQVSVSGLRPCRVLLKPDAGGQEVYGGGTARHGVPGGRYLLWPFIDGAQFGQ